MFDHLNAAKRWLDRPPRSTPEERAIDAQIASAHALVALVETLHPRYDRDLLLDTLVNHQHREDNSCICGWAELGFLHPKHVIDTYEARLKAGG